MRLLPLPGVFQPISDSWMLAACLRREQPGAGSAVLDLCSGSGMLAVLAATLGASATAVDVSRRALLSARLNARLNGVEVECLRGDLFAAVASRRFHLIVSNPPYVPGPSDQLPRAGLARAWEAGPTGRAFIDRICAEAHLHLRPGGALLLVQNTLVGEADTLSALSATGLEVEVLLRHHGRLGPLLRERAGWLRAEGRLTGSDHDELIVIRARRPASPDGDTGRAPSLG